MDQRNLLNYNIREYNTYKPTLQETDFISNLLNFQPNDISYLYFNDKNIDLINNKLILLIKDETFSRYGKKLLIEPQRKNTILTIMRHIYLKNVKNQFPAEEEVANMNQLTLDEMFPVVMNGLLSQIRFINDRNTYIRTDALPLPESSNKRIDNLPSTTTLFGF
jgi:hypothetical protein